MFILLFILVVRVTSIGKEVTTSVADVITELGRDLRQLKGLPLSITSLQGAAPAFRHTEVRVCVTTLS